MECEYFHTILSAMNCVWSGSPQIPTDLVVDRRAPNGESGSRRPFLFRYDVWTMFHGQISEKITSALSMT
jgi:hypothetical protein